MLQIRRLIVKNFRGIKSTDWRIDSRLVCIVGPGDSTKTTLLDAMGLVLSRNYSPQFTDADFYNCDTSHEISICAVVSDLPKSIRKLNAFGNYLVGVRGDGTLVEEADEESVDAIVIRLTVDSSLEPSWAVVNSGGDVGTGISAQSRKQLGFFRLGEHVDTHLRWGRTSALRDLSENSDDTKQIMSEAQRSARDSVFSSIPQELIDITKIIDVSSKQLGAGHLNPLRPGLDPTGTPTAHALMLHDDKIPMTQYGLGTRRIVGLTIQERAAEGGVIIAIDEVEHGLDPHRLIRLLHHLRKSSSESGQIFLTSHSPQAIINLKASDIFVVRSDIGITRVQNVSEDISYSQSTVRSGPEALLAKRVVVAEGSTEIGFISQWFRFWDSKDCFPNGSSIVASGTAVTNGGGDSACSRARVYNNLGYPTLLALDNDARGIDGAVLDAKREGIHVVRTSLGRCLEQEVIMGLPIECVPDLITAAIQQRGEDSILSHLRSKFLPVSVACETRWNNLDTDPLKVQSGIAELASDKKWFKSQDGGQSLADVCHKHLEPSKAGDLFKYLEAIRVFAQGDIAPADILD